MAKWIELFPQDAHTGERPTVVRGAVKFNGVGVGPMREERVKVAHEAVKALCDRQKVLQAIVPNIPRQVAAMYGRASYSSQSVLNHLARNNEPDVSDGPLQRAAEGQTRLFRKITATSDKYLPDCQLRHDASPSDRCVQEAMNLPYHDGGCGWSDVRAASGAAHAAMVIDAGGSRG